MRINVFFYCIFKKNRKQWLSVVILLWIAISPILGQQFHNRSSEPMKINDSEVPDYSVTPDSSYRFFGVWLGDSIGYHIFSKNLKHGDSIRLTKGPGYPGKVMLSPSGRLIVYEWIIDDKFTELRIVGIDGSNPRVLYSDSVLFSILQEWSPDEKYVSAMVFKNDRTFKTLLIPVSNDSLKVLRKQQFKSMNRGLLLQSKMSFSRDGLFITYDISSGESWYNRDIFIRLVAGGKEIPIVRHPANDLLIGWTPGDQAILFASDRSGRWDLWTIQVLNGKPHGLPKIVKENIGSPINVLNFTKDGSLYYKLGVHDKFDLSIATLDTASKKINNKKILSSHVGFNASVQWSRDGQYLAYAWGIGTGYEPLTLAILSDKSGKERLITLDKLMRHGGHGFEPQWSPDGRYIIATARVRDYNGPGMDSQGLYQIDLKTGRHNPVMLSSDICGLDCMMTPLWLTDGRIIFERRVTQSLVIKNLKTEEEKELFRAVPPALVWIFPTSNVAVSPDDKRLAFILSQRKNNKWIHVLMVVPTAGGEAKEVFRISDGQRITIPAWMQDSRNIIFALNKVGQAFSFQLIRIDVDSGKPENLGMTMEGVVPYSLSVHPDGKRIAFTSGKESYYREETWVLKNFLPAHKTK